MTGDSGLVPGSRSKACCLPWVMLSVCEDLPIFFNAMGFKGEVSQPPMERQDG
jgi:hypothetical protein